MNLNSDRVLLLAEAETHAVVCDARIAAIRWDLVPWSLVLDLDIPISEQQDARMRRAWVVFFGISMCSLSLSNARLPTGIWITSKMWVETLFDRGFRKASFRVLLIEGNSSEAAENNASKEVAIVCRKIVGVTSVDSCVGGELGLTWKDRTGLASDAELRNLLVNYEDE